MGRDEQRRGNAGCAGGPSRTDDGAATCSDRPQTATARAEAPVTIRAAPLTDREGATAGRQDTTFCFSGIEKINTHEVGKISPAYRSGKILHLDI